mgnify:FL=1
MPLYDGNKQILTSGYGTGLTDKQKTSRAWVLDPMVGSHETVEGGANAGAGTVLSATKTISFCKTATSKGHVILPNGTVTGQIKIIVHHTLANSVDLVITPTNFSAGTNITSDAVGRVTTCVWDGSNWHSLENGGMVIG